ncbi:MAG TPA: hypothetical protein VK327_09840 [Candidatus Paceibacterota bacterium]|nr:hypothetical protein [Candidatus Paceibacterota bacterium]
MGTARGRVFLSVARSEVIVAGFIPGNNWFIVASFRDEDDFLPAWRD